MTVSADAGGMHLSVRLDAPLDDVAVSEAARAHGLALSPLSAYCLADGAEAGDAPYNGFLLGYAEATPEASDTLMQALGNVVREMLPDVKAATVLLQ
jgi:GntR family transcriptional regulator/MocR family aminotransferase